MRRLPLAVIALLAVSSCSSSASTVVVLSGHRSAVGAVSTDSYAPWPQAGHDARRSGASSSTGPRTAALRWTRRLEGNVTPGPVIGPGGTIYAASNEGTLHALDPRTGTDLWTFKPSGSYGIDLSTSPAVLASGTLLWPGPGALYALDAKGTLLWKESPTDPHRAYETAGTHLFALDDGKVAWRQDLGSTSEVSPAVAPDGTVVAASNDPVTRAFSPAGREVWRYDRHAETYSSPVVTDDGIAYFGDHHAVVTGLDVTTGKVVARYQGPREKPKDGRSIGIWTSPVIDSTHAVYWGSRSGHLHAVDAAGKQLFDLDTGATLDSYPALGDGLLVVGVTDGRLLAVGT
jgi:outer membrane protein assembly factor BamB